MSKARLAQLRAVSACLVTEAPKKHVQRTPTPACALPQNSAAGARCRPGARALQRALLSGRAMPLSWTGALRTVVAPTADVPVHRPGHQLPVLPVPTLCPAADTPPYLPARRHRRPPPRAAPAPPRAAAPPEAPWRRLPCPDPGPGADTDRDRCLRDGPGRRSAGTRRTAALESSGAAGACATHQTRPAGTGGGSGEAAAPPPGPPRPPQEAGRQLGPIWEREQEALGPRLVQSEGTSGFGRDAKPVGVDPGAAATLPGVRGPARLAAEGGCYSTAVGHRAMDLQRKKRGLSRRGGGGGSLSGQLQLVLRCIWLTQSLSVKKAKQTGIMQSSGNWKPLLNTFFPLLPTCHFTSSISLANTKSAAVLLPILTVFLWPYTCL